MVEFSIVAAVFSFMLLGMFEFGYAAWARSSVAADAREGARYAMVRGTTSLLGTADSASVANFVKTKTGLDQSIVVVTTWSPSTKKAGSLVTVKVRHVTSRRGPFLPTRTDSASSTMIVVY